MGRTALVEAITHLDMGFDLRSQLLEVLHNRAVDGATEVRVLVCDRACLVANAVEDILPRPCQIRLVAAKRTDLKASFAQELVARTEGHLDDGSELRHLAGDIVLNVCDALKVRN